MSEIAVKANSTEAYHLYLRGVAAARGGNRRVAAGLLTRSVQLDPHNESSWLWLSGVLDEPHQIAFCLSSVLKLNPANERARQGLRWLEERQMLNGAARPSPVLDVKVPEPGAAALAERAPAEVWWIHWRRSWREWRWIRLIAWVMPLLLICVALLIHQTFTQAIAASLPKPTSLPLPTVAAATQPAPRPTAAPILAVEPASLHESLTVGYLSALEPLRQQLRNAVDSYRNATGLPGGASVSHVSAAQTLRATVEQVRATIADLRPPADLVAAHESYLKGLELELLAIDDILEFYSTYKVELANRAALRFQESNAYLDRARAEFDARALQMQVYSSISPHSLR
jgi:hypothetical protein